MKRLVAAAFDVPASKRAFENHDVETWLAFFAPDAEWRKYRPGVTAIAEADDRKDAIRARLTSIAGLSIEQAISGETIREKWIAVAFLVTLPDGRYFIERAILRLADSEIARQVEVEARD